MTPLDEALRALVNTIIRDCCESETSDPERDDTIMIREGTLREILERALLSSRQEVAPVACLSVAVRMLLDSAPQHMTHRNAKEREAYKLLRSIMKETT